MDLQDIIAIIGIYFVIILLMVFNFIAVYYLNDILIKRDNYYETHRTIKFNFLLNKSHELFLFPFVLLLFNMMLVVISIALLIIIIFTKNDFIGFVYCLFVLTYTLIIALIDNHFKKNK